MYRLHVHGTPREMGLAHGETFRGPIRELAAIRSDLLRKRMPGWCARDVEALASDQIAALARHEAVHQEFDGIAQGSGVSPHALMVLNNYTDMRDFDAQEEGCSTFSVRFGSRHVCGQTWDMHATARPYVLHLSRAGEHPAEVLTLTGCLALAGINRHNVGVFINNMNCTETGPGLMWPALVQTMLARQSAREALRFLGQNLPCSGHNYLVCDPGATLNIEATGRQLEVTFDSAKGVVYHTNHYVGTLQRHERLNRRSKTSLPRHANLGKFFAGRAAEAADLQLIARELCSASGANHVCVPYTGDDASVTCGGILYDMAGRSGIVFAGTFDENEHSAFHLPGRTTAVQ